MKTPFLKEKKQPVHYTADHSFFDRPGPEERSRGSQGQDEDADPEFHHSFHNRHPLDKALAP